MTRYSNGFEGQTDGTTVTGANSAVSGTAFSSVTISAATLTYSTAAAHLSALGMQAVYGPAFSTAYVHVTVAPATATTRVAARAYVSFTDASTTSQRGEQFLAFRTASAVVGWVQLAATGEFILADSTSTLATGPVAAPGTVYRVEAAATPGTTTTNGTLEAAVYVGDSTIPVWTAIVVGNVGTAALALVRYGRSGSTYAGRTVNFDDLAADDALPSGWIGPTQPSLARPATARAGYGGLVASSSLVPSSTLVPSGRVYAGAPVTPHQIAMGVGIGGALVDVSPYVEFGEGIGYTWGRSDQFDDTSPGTFTFTLNNADGRFTPGNAASPLATTVVEGMTVTWLLGTRLVTGAILAVEFGTDQESWDLLKVTCDDMLGSAGRHQLTALADGLLNHAPAQLLWRLDESDGVTGAETATGTASSLGAFQVTRTGANTADAVTFGVQQVDGLPGTAVTVTAQAGEQVYFGTNRGNTAAPVPVLPYPTVMPAAVSGAEYLLGWWNCWIYPGSTINLAVTYGFATVGGRWAIVLQVTPSGLSIRAGTYPLTAMHSWTSAEMLAPQWVSMRVRRAWVGSQWWVFVSAWVADVQVGQEVVYNDPQANDARAWNLATDPFPVQVELAVDNRTGSVPLSGTVQRVSHTLNGTGNEKNALFNTVDDRRAVLDFISAEIVSQTYPGTTLSAAPIGYPDIAGGSVLDVYNDIQRTEQGHLFCTTSGSLTSPTQVIQIRARDRPTTVKAAFHVTDDLDGLPVFLRDIANLAATIDVAGPADSVTVTDETVKAITTRYLALGLSEQILNTDRGDLAMWGQDRLNRGKNTAIRTQTFTIDLANTPVDRSADVLGLVPGDRVQLTGLPAGRVGSATWDGWVLGVTEEHSVGSNRFTIAVQPTLDPPLTLDTGRVGNGGELFVAVAMTATATTMILTATGGTDVLSETVPYTLRLGAAEHVQVTAVDGTGRSATVVRGVDGTTAVAQGVGNTIGVLTPSILGF